MQPEHALELLGDAGAAVPAHDLRVGARAQTPAAIEPADERVLRKYVFRAPEPIGVPAPDVVVDGEIVLALLADRAVVDVLVRVIARIGRTRREAAEREVHLARREHRAVDE